MADTQKETFWTRLASGKLPSMDINTDVTIDQNSVLKAAAIFFIAAVLILAAYFAIRKQITV
jgi:hypothetical protein